MTYTLNFALNLNKEGEYIIYDPEQFADKPIPISVPEIITILDGFIEQSCQKAGILDNPGSQKVQSDDDLSEEKVQGAVQAVHESLIPQSPLRGLSGQAYYCQVKDLDPTQIKGITSDLSTYLQETISKLNSDNFLADETSFLLSGIKEAIDIRNYLVIYVNNPQKKIYKNGYLFIMSI